VIELIEARAAAHPPADRFRGHESDRPPDLIQLFPSLSTLTCTAATFQVVFGRVADSITKISVEQCTRFVDATDGFGTAFFTGNPRRHEEMMQTGLPRRSRSST
jgi:hypothetical protein